MGETPTPAFATFDAQAYTSAMGELQVLDQPFITSATADRLADVITQQTELFRSSLQTDHFTETLSILEKLAKLPRTSSSYALVDTIPAFAEKVLQNLQTHIDEQPDRYLMPAYRLAQSCLDTRLQSITSRIFAANCERLLADTSLSEEEGRTVVQQTIAYANPEQIRALVRLARTPDSVFLQRFPREIDSPLNINILGENIAGREEKMIAILDELTNNQGKRLMTAWEESRGDQLRNNENFGVICELEKARPGITSFLIEHYNILCFGRYPLPMLIDQYDTRNEKNIPYGVLIEARHDNNGAAYAERNILARAYEQAQQTGSRIKIFEADSPNDVVVAVERAFTTHGFISYMLLIAHGTEDELIFSKDTEKNGHSQSWEALAKMRDHFTRSAAIALISCYAGKAGGFAQQLSMYIPEIDIHTADDNVYLRNIVVEKTNETLAVRVMFGHGEINKNTIEDELFEAATGFSTGRTHAVHIDRVPTRIYRNGSVIDDYVA